MQSLKIGDQEFHSLEELIHSADLEQFKVYSKKTGEELNVYEYFWKLLRESIHKSDYPEDGDNLFLDEFTYPEGEDDAS